MQVTLEDYFAQHRVGHESECTPAVIEAATETVLRHNLLLAAMVADGVSMTVNPITKTMYSSGWRPEAVNAGTLGAAIHSTHITGFGGDLYDPLGHLDAWCMDNQDKLAEIGLWLEHPDSTPHWCHTDRRLRINRVFRIKS